MVVTFVVGGSKPIRSISKTEGEQNPTGFFFVVFFLYWCFGLPGNDEENKIELNY